MWRVDRGEQGRTQGDAAGTAVEQFVGEVLGAEAATAMALRGISGSVRKRFLESGMSGEELAERLEREDHAARGCIRFWNAAGRVGLC